MAERFFEISSRPYWFEVDDLDICKGRRIVVTEVVWQAVAHALGHVYITMDRVKESADEGRQ